jgi:hypothetical protein
LASSESHSSCLEFLRFIPPTFSSMLPMAYVIHFGIGCDRKTEGGRASSRVECSGVVLE